MRQVSSKIIKSKIIKKAKTINNFYKKILNKKPYFAILGLNPHNFSATKKFEEKKIILPAIKTIKKAGIKAMGPIPPATSFMLFKEKKFDIIFIFGGVQRIPDNLFDSLKNDGGTLITVLYDDNDIGKIHIVKKLNGKISRTNYISAQTPILKEFQKIRKEFIL